MMQCSSCDRPLRAVVHREVHVDVCDCGGMWFDRGELDTWMRRERIPPPLAPVVGVKGAATSSCPRCATKTLERRTIEGASGGRCSRCTGVWLSAAAIAKFDPAPREPGGSGWYTFFDGVIQLAAAIW